MGFSLDADHAFDVLYDEVVTRGMLCGSELLNDGSLCESYIIFICRDDLVGILLSGPLDHLEETALLFLTIDDEGAAKNLVSAVLAVDLCKAKDFTVSQFASQLALHFMQIVDFLGRKRPTLLLVVGLPILSDFDGIRLAARGE